MASRGACSSCAALVARVWRSISNHLRNLRIIKGNGLKDGHISTGGLTFIVRPEHRSGLPARKAHANASTVPWSTSSGSDPLTLANSRADSSRFHRIPRELFHYKLPRGRALNRVLCRIPTMIARIEEPLQGVELELETALCLYPSRLIVRTEHRKRPSRL